MLSRLGKNPGIISLRHIQGNTMYLTTWVVGVLTALKPQNKVQYTLWGLNSFQNIKLRTVVSQYQPSSTVTRL